MPKLKRNPTLRRFAIAALIVALLASPLYLSGRPESAPPADPAPLLQGLAVSGTEIFQADAWEEDGARYLRLTAAFTNAGQTNLLHNVVEGEELIVEQINITGGPFDAASDMIGYFAIGDVTNTPHYFSFTPNDTRVYDLSHPITLNAGDRVLFYALESTGTLQSSIATFVGRPLPPSAIAVK